MLPSIASVLNENKESLLSDLAAIAACNWQRSLGSLWARREMSHFNVRLNLVIMIEAF